MPESPFTITTIHNRVGRYLKRQSKPMQQRFWDALAQICQGPFPSDNPAKITHLIGQPMINIGQTLCRARGGW